MSLSRSANKKLSHDVLWTMSSFAVLTVSGLAINASVAALRDASALGIFNLAYAVYVVSSQFAVAGVHYSVLRWAAHLSGDKEERARMLSTAALLVLLLGLVVGPVVFFSEPLFVAMFDSEQSARAASYAGLGLILFPLNKVLIAYVNGARHMRAFSLFQAARYVLVMVSVTVVAVSSWQFEYAAFSFLIAEAATAIAALTYLTVIGEFRFARPHWSWVRKHLFFGAKSLPSGAFLEVNTRIDVLAIGIFLNERAVGIYSFAALLFDGLCHVLAMLRVNVNPIIVAARRDDAWAECQRLYRLSRLYLMPGMFLLSVITLVGYFVLVEYLFTTQGLIEGLWPLCVLLIGLSIISATAPFDNLLMVSGFPGYQTFQNLVLVVCNVMLNIALVPVIGIMGAAIGTAVSYLVGMVILIVLARRKLGWNMLSNKFEPARG